MKLLEGKTVVVIGGTSGMGLSGAAACLDAGANVVAVGRDDSYGDQARSILGDSVTVILKDAAEKETSEEAIAAAVERFGALDALYHVAGGSGRALGDGPLHEITDEGWDATLDLNLKSVFLSNRAAIRRFLEQERGGSILNLSTALAFSPSPAYFSTHAYAAAKSGIVGLTKAAAARYASDNIRVNALAPGLVDTPMAQRAASNTEIMEFVRTRQSLDGGRIGMPSDLDAAVVYFLSDGSKFVTGQVLAVDGGWSVNDGHERAPGGNEA